LGDNDTGFKQNGDGILDVYANSRHVLRFLSNSIYSFCDTNVSGNLNIRGDNRLHYIMRNNDDSVRMYIWKDKGGDAVRINNGIDGGGDFAFGKNGEFYSPGSLHAGGAVIAGDGNVYGTRWGGWLFDYLNRSFVRDIRLGALSSLTIWNGPGWSDRSGYVMTGAVNGNQDALVDTAQARPIQKYINGNWYNVGSL
ncbi:TPA: phage tail protein, partial [Escherichia coli]